MTTPRRYVRVWTLRLPIVGRVWRCYACGLYSETSWGQSLSALVASRAERHAAECPAVAAAMERDQLLGEVARLEVDLGAAYSGYVADNAAYIRHNAELATERDQLRAELDRMRADRDQLRERLNQINPLNKDNE